MRVCKDQKKWKKTWQIKDDHFRLFLQIVYYTLARGIHEFRNARISELLEAGVNPKAIQELLGHKKIAMTMERYARINLDGLRKAVEKL